MVLRTKMTKEEIIIMHRVVEFIRKALNEIGKLTTDKPENTDDAYRVQLSTGKGKNGPKK